MAEEDDPMSDNDVPENVHNRLLGAISHLYKQKRVKAPVRKESSYHVSEFHLTKTGNDEKKKDKVQISELSRVLDKRVGHVKITEQIKSAKTKSRKLPKPLEKPQADKVQRSVGFENLKKDLNKWDAIVYHQRAAEEVNFPLKVPKVLVHRSPTAFLNTFKKPTELELQLAESINADLMKNAENEEKEPDEFSLSLQEMKERRSLMARLRAQLSYKEAKAARQNKIKSKKFHRIQRKDKIKNQIKEFEELQKTDPEAALKKLEQLEKARAQERASLRHKTTGQWAKNLAVRAKYNKEARVALSEQLTRSRELTQKLKQDSTTDEDTDSDNDEKETSKDTNNSWLNKEPNSEVQTFYDKYMKYCEQEMVKEKVSEPLSRDGLNIVKNTKENNVSKDVESLSINGSNQAKNIRENDVSEKDTKIKLPKKCTKLKQDKLENESAKSLSPVPSKKSKNKCKNNVSSNNRKRKICTKIGTWSVTPVSENCKLEVNRAKKTKRLNPVEVCVKTNSDSNTFSVKTKPKADVNIDDMFYDIEYKINKKVISKMKNLKESLNMATKNVIQDEISDTEDNNNNSSLEIKKQKLRPDIDEELNENTSNTYTNDNSLKKIIENTATLSKGVTKNLESNKVTNNIEPNKFFHAKPKHLRTELPGSFADAESNLDDIDEVSKAEEKSMTISEAFACDDVDEEFKREKEEEIKKSEFEDINLELPGWGSWGGPNVQTSKRASRRFIIKLPKRMPRKDENKGNVVINEDKDEKIKPHMVTELPFPFTSVKEYEASIRAPVGSTWLPQSAHRKLIAPTVNTKLGAVIEPMTKDQIVKSKEDWK